MIVLRRYLLLLLGTGLILVGQEERRVSTSAPVKNYKVSFFSDEGFPRVRVVGESADLKDAQNIKLTGMELILYTGTADRDTEATLTAPVAILQPDEELVSGPEAVRLVRPDLELDGKAWRYDHRESRIHIRREARVVFKVPLEGLLE